MTQPITIISQALLDIGAREAGESPAVDDTTEAFAALNQMLDQWANENMMIFAKNEIIHELVGGQYIYTIGQGGSVGCSFTGSIAPNSNGTGSILTVTAISSGGISVGQIVNSGLANTIITGYGTGVGGSSSGALGTYYLSQVQTVVSGALTSYAQRPQSISSAFVRTVNSITGTLDYPVSVISLEKYELIGIKTLPGPWPRAVYYQPSEPVATLNYWPNPSQGEMHLITTNNLLQFKSLTDNVTLPEGYESALRYNLALRLMPSYGKSNQMQVEMIRALAQQGKSVIKRTNMQPQQSASFDAVLMPGKINDASFILSGGFA